MIRFIRNDNHKADEIHCHENSFGCFSQPKSNCTHKAAVHTKRIHARCTYAYTGHIRLCTHTYTHGAYIEMHRPIYAMHTHIYGIARNIIRPYMKIARAYIRNVRSAIRIRAAYYYKSVKKPLFLATFFLFPCTGKATTKGLFFCQHKPQF